MKERKTPKLPFGGVATKVASQPNGCKAAAKAFFKELAAAIGVGTFVYKYNPCGDWGEASFSTEKLYVSVDFDAPPDSELGVLVRTHKGFSDFVGGLNHWLSVKDATLENVAALCMRLTQNG